MKLTPGIPVCSALKVNVPARFPRGRLFCWFPAKIDAKFQIVFSFRPTHSVANRPGVVGLKVILRIANGIEGDSSGSSAPVNSGTRSILQDTSDAQQSSATILHMSRTVRISHAIVGNDEVIQNGR